MVNRATIKYFINNLISHHKHGAKILYDKLLNKKLLPIIYVAVQM